MNLVFADAAFWIALRDGRDAHHAVSLELAKYFFQHRMPLVITSFVFAEVHAYFSRSRELKERIIRDCWENPVVRIEQPTYEDQTHALKILRGQQDKQYSFCDAVSFSVMMRLDIERVVTFDHHFRQFGGFEVLDENTI